MHKAILILCIAISLPSHTHTHTHSILDLSFNHIPQIGGLETLVNLEKIFLIQNKFTKIENLSTLTNLTMLELGSNRIRVRIYTEY